MKSHLFFSFSRGLVVILIATIPCIDAYGQGWFKSYPTVQTDGVIRTAQDTPGGDIFWVGWEYPGGVSIGRTDAEGNLLWDTVIPFSVSVIARDMALTAEGNITILFDHQYAPNKWVSHLLHTDPLGNVLWNQTVFSDSLDWSADLVQLSDGGYLISGKRVDSTAVIRTDPMGNFKWSFMYKEPDAAIMNGRFIDVDAQGKILLSIYVASMINEQNRMLIRQTDSTGVVFWQKEFNTWMDDYGYGRAAYTPNGDILVSGSYQDSFFIQKMTSSGDSVWRTNLLPVQYVLHNSQFSPTQDGGGVMAGLRAYVVDDFFVGKCSSSGEVEWRKIIQKPAGYGGMSILSINQTSDGGYLLAGEISLNGTDKPLLIRLDSEGNLLTTITEPDVEKLEKTLAYPNPAYNGARLQISKVSEGVFELFETSGQRIFQNHIVNGEVSLENSNLPLGIYFFKIWNKNHVAGMGKLIVH